MKDKKPIQKNKKETFKKESDDNLETVTFQIQTPRFQDESQSAASRVERRLTLRKNHIRVPWIRFESMGKSYDTQVPHNERGTLPSPY